MPYIHPRSREILQKRNALPTTAGQLNYCITIACNGYIVEHGLSYEVLNSVIGILTSIQHEYPAKFKPAEQKLVDTIEELIVPYDPGKALATCGLIGVLECAKLELYARVVRPYEEQKRYDNGDVYSKEILS